MRSCLKIFASLVVVLAVAACSEGPDSTFDSSSSETSVLGPNLSTGIEPGCIGDLVWHDENGNGCQDSGESGIEGVKLEAVRCSDGQVVDETTSDQTGYYALYVPGDGGTYYRVRVTFPEGYTAATTDADCGDESYKKDNDVDSGGETFCTYMVDGRMKKYIDIGLVKGDTPPPPPDGKKLCLGDRVWFDEDCDGIQDSGESGVKGVVVNLYECGGGLIGSTETDSNGLYEFCELDAGDYYVEFIAPDGHFFSPQDVGSDDEVDSDADSKGMTACVTLKDKDDRTVDAGLCEEKKGGEGCTPGYWKNHHFAWVGYTPGEMYDTVFGVALFPGMSLGEVIAQGGGGYNRIGRHSVAALLSAAHPDVDSGATPAEVIAMVQDAVANPEKVEMIGDMLEELNEQDCPLSGRAPSVDRSTGF